MIDYTNLSDHDLLHLVRQCDAAATYVAVEKCHGALMQIWNQYAEQMRRRNFMTQDAREAVEDKIVNYCQRGGDMRFKTMSQFCAWSRKILRHWILDQLRKSTRFVTLSPNPIVDPNQMPPDQQVLTFELAAKLIAYSRLNAFDQILLEYLANRVGWTPGMIADEMKEKHPEIWQEHQARLDSEQKVQDECSRALTELNREAEEIYDELLKDLSEDEVAEIERDA